MLFFLFHSINYFLLLTIPFTASITINFTNIVQEHMNGAIIINDEGANNSDGGIQLTGSYKGVNAGRATYFQPLHLLDNRSQELASFSTNFTFVIDSDGSNSFGDGFTFFLALNNSVITDQGAMGLPFTSTPDSASSPFVAVEFDTFWNDWDPRVSNGIPIGDHVAIDVSSVSSVKSQNWFSNVTGKGVCQAWIRYDSVSKYLTVSFTGFENNTVVHQDGLVYTVDLKTELPEWVVFGFSGATGAMFRRNMLSSWSFASSDLVADKNNTVRARNRKVGLIVGLTIIITSLAVLVLIIWKKNNKQDVLEQIGFDVEMNKEFEIGSRPKQFSYIELAQSTGDFAEENKLGEGGFGRVYKGFLKDSNKYIAVKRVSKSSEQEIKKYAAKVRIFSQLRHKNLVQLTGWCQEKGELLLVYDYMENGSLDWHLFKAKSLLTWSVRYKIANGLASAIWYIHEGWEQCALHRDIRLSKVLLDSNFNAKLGDFRLAKLVDHEKDSQTMMLAHKATKESDVFSFGVIALELACGQKPIMHKGQEKQIEFIEWVWELYGTNTLTKAVDPCLGSDFEVEEIKGFRWAMVCAPSLRIAPIDETSDSSTQSSSFPTCASLNDAGDVLFDVSCFISIWCWLCYP